jgi:hypothetical protein
MLVQAAIPRTGFTKTHDAMFPAFEKFRPLG